MIFRNHFCNVLAGHPQALEPLVHQDSIPSDNRFADIDPLVAFDVIPSLIDIVSSFSVFKQGKAWRESQLSSDVFKRFPFEIAKVIYPMILK